MRKQMCLSPNQVQGGGHMALHIVCFLLVPMLTGDIQVYSPALIHDLTWWNLLNWNKT